MAEIIRSPEVAGKSRLLSSNSTASEQTTATFEENTHTGEQPAYADAVSTDTPVRVVSAEEVEQVYGQYKTDHQYLEENVDQANEEIEKYRIEIAGLQEKIQLLEESIEQEKNAAIKRGFNEGYEEGDAAARENLDKKAQQLQNLFNSFDESRESVLQSQEDAMLEIVTVAISKILGEKYVTPECTVAAVRSAMEHVTQRDQLLFRVAPGDYELLNEYKQELFAGLDQLKSKLVADEKVTLGGCILENQAGSIDKRLEVQLQSFIDTLIRVRNQRRSV